MKEKSAFISAILFVLCMLASYLSFSLLAYIINTDMSYREVLNNGHQLIAAVFLYWWFPGMFLIYDRHPD